MGNAQIPDRMVISLAGKRALYKGDLMLLEMLAQHNWTRPLYVALTVGADNYMNLGENFIQEGLVNRITPFHTNDSNNFDTEKTYDMMEIQNFMITLMDEPEIIERLFHIVTDYKVEIAREAVKRGFKLGHHGDDLGTQTSTFFSEEQFVTFLKPRLKEIFSVWRDAGLPMQMHSCGFITPLIPHLVDIGLTVLEPCQPCMDLAFLKREYGKDLVFYGGIDTQKLLAFDPPEKVYEETLRTIDIMAKDGGYIVGPAQEIMDNVSPANVDAMVRAIRHYRGDD
jgi:uroporphyrinogen decarboxylase